MESTKNFMENLKLRVGYGVTGTASINPYSTVATLEDGYYSLGGDLVSTYLFSRNISNQNLIWEKSYNTNIGFDVSFLNRRIDLTMDYYITKTNGVIWNQSLPIVNGGYNATTQYTIARNIAKTKNKGFEMTLNTHNFSTRDFTWDTTLTFTLNNEKVKSLIGGTSDHIKNANTDYWLNIGHPVNSFYAYKIDGMWQNGELTDAAAFGCTQGAIKVNVPGMKEFVDGHFYKIGDDGIPIIDANGDTTTYKYDKTYA